MTILKMAVRPEILPITAIILGSCTLAVAHVAKLAYDPHTAYLRKIDDKREWESRDNFRYRKYSWTQYALEHPDAIPAIVKV